MGVQQPAPSRTATLYRVAYRRADRDPRKGYTYKVFKGEVQARGFINRLLTPPDEQTAEKYRELAPIAECHLHLAVVRWEPVDPTTTNDVLDHTGDVFVGGEYRSRESAEQRLEYLRTDVAMHAATNIIDVRDEIIELEAALS